MKVGRARQSEAQGLLELAGAKEREVETRLVLLHVVCFFSLAQDYHTNGIPRKLIF